MRAPAANQVIDGPMERFIFWALFVAGVVLAAWVPASSAYPDLGRQVGHILLRTPG